MEDAHRGQGLAAKLVYYVVENKKCVVYVSPSSISVHAEQREAILHAEEI